MSLLGIRVSPASFLRAVTMAALLSAAEGAWAAPSTVAAEPVISEIQKRLAVTAEPLKVEGELLDAVALRAFYQARAWRPAWTERRDAVISVLSSADLEGLPTAPFHLAALAKLNGKTGRIADEDLLMTDALLRYALAMRGQRVDPTSFEDDWFLPVPPFDAVAWLGAHTAEIGPALQRLQPPYAAYQLLRQKLAELKAIAAAGDWPKVPTGQPIKPGAADERIPAVRRRLVAAGLLPASALEPTAPPAPPSVAPQTPAPQSAVPPTAGIQPASATIGGDSAPAAAPESPSAAPDAPPPPPANIYDPTVQAAVQIFQQRHGLLDDGVLGRQTVAAMNVSAAQRARQVALNMERWRWLPQRLETNHIVVNVPGAWLEVVEDGKAVLSMKVVVGDPDHPTPGLHARMSSLVLNPIWRIPASIATNEILPKLKKDPGYLIANDLELVSDSFAPGSPESQGVGIAWRDFATMPWPVRQRAGSDNALGRIKFNIPNNDDIYLHDTPNHKAFGRTFRALSHGCVRVEKPDELAVYVLNDKDWSQAKLDEQIDSGQTRTVTVNRHLPVWLLYWTTWVDANGVLQVRDDIYGRDQRLAEALTQSARAPLMVEHRSSATPQVVRCDGCRVP